MKKILCILAILATTTTTFAKLNDGKFKAEDKDFDRRGWKVYNEITVKDGKIVGADFDYVNKNGELKSKDIEYNKKYREISKIDVPELKELFEADLIKTQNPNDLEEVAGATQSLVQFKQLSEVAMKASEDNNKNPVSVEVK